MDTKASLRSLYLELGHLIDAYEPGDRYFDDFVERSKVIGKAKEIQHVLTDKQDLPMQLAAQTAELSVLQLVTEVDLLKHFPSSEYITVSKLADSSGVQPALLRRILRMLTVTGYISQNPGNTEEFAQSYLSRGLRDTADWFAFVYRLLMYRKNFSKFFIDPDITGHKPLTEPTDVRYCPMSYEGDALGTPFWEVLYRDPEFVSLFQKAFVGVDNANAIVGCYDFGQLAESTDNDGSDRLTLVDMGGGLGQSIVQILEAHPQMNPSKFMLQDLPEPIALATQSNMLPKSTAKRVHDFFTPQPEAARGAKAYFLRRVIHDWADDACVKILKHVADAMSKDSVVLIADLVIPDRVEQKDLPLVANDWIVLAITGKERTVREFSDLLDAAGLELVQVHRQNPYSGASTIVEGRLKQ